MSKKIVVEMEDELAVNLCVLVRREVAKMHATKMSLYKDVDAELVSTKLGMEWIADVVDREVAYRDFIADLEESLGGHLQEVGK